MKLFLSIIISLLAACRPISQEKTSTAEVQERSINVFTKDTLVQLFKFSMIIPKGWRLANDDTLPKVANMTFYRRLHNSNGKLVYLEHGFQTIGDRSEPDVVPARMREGWIRNNNDTSGVLFSDDPRLTAYRKQQKYKYSFESIGGHRAKFFEPKHTGVGYTGVYIDSVGIYNEYVAEFSLYAKNLDSLEIIELKQVIRTLVLKPYN